ncbi:hypothetical protein CSUI_007691 [Cystoisospora suis]|uniref:Transmembrane protein n=1 Tax=Cystoisospora suis TaxID=483139 RepID=A0A2C6KCU7_9APIC|nr:hypothetical protein CSUI_007691 [Cystoisospora suis]
MFSLSRATLLVSQALSSPLHSHKSDVKDGESFLSSPNICFSSSCRSLCIHEGRYIFLVLSLYCLGALSLQIARLLLRAPYLLSLLTCDPTLVLSSLLLSSSSTSHPIVLPSSSSSSSHLSPTTDSRRKSVLSTLSQRGDAKETRFIGLPPSLRHPHKRENRSSHVFKPTEEEREERDMKEGIARENRSSSSFSSLPPFRLLCQDLSFTRTGAPVERRRRPSFSSFSTCLHRRLEESMVQLASEAVGLHPTPLILPPSSTLSSLFKSSSSPQTSPPLPSSLHGPFQGASSKPLHLSSSLFPIGTSFTLPERISERRASRDSPRSVRNKSQQESERERRRRTRGDLSHHLHMSLPSSSSLSSCSLSPFYRRLKGERKHLLVGFSGIPSASLSAILSNIRRLGESLEKEEKKEGRESRPASQKYLRRPSFHTSFLSAPHSVYTREKPSIATLPGTSFSSLSRQQGRQGAEEEEDMKRKKESDSSFFSSSPYTSLFPSFPPHSSRGSLSSCFSLSDRDGLIDASLRVAEVFVKVASECSTLLEKRYLSDVPTRLFRDVHITTGFEGDLVGKDDLPSVQEEKRKKDGDEKEEEEKDVDMVSRDSLGASRDKEREDDPSMEGGSNDGKMKKEGERGFFFPRKDRSVRGGHDTIRGLSSLTRHKVIDRYHSIFSSLPYGGKKNGCSCLYERRLDEEEDWGGDASHLDPSSSSSCFSRISSRGFDVGNRLRLKCQVMQLAIEIQKGHFSVPLIFSSSFEESRLHEEDLCLPPSFSPEHCPPSRLLQPEADQQGDSLSSSSSCSSLHEEEENIRRRKTLFLLSFLLSHTKKVCYSLHLLLCGILERISSLLFSSLPSSSLSHLKRREAPERPVFSARNKNRCAPSLVTPEEISFSPARGRGRSSPPLSPSLLFSFHSSNESLQHFSTRQTPPFSSFHLVLSENLLKERLGLTLLRDLLVNFLKIFFISDINSLSPSSSFFSLPSLPSHCLSSGTSREMKKMAVHEEESSVSSSTLPSVTMQVLEILTSLLLDGCKKDTEGREAGGDLSAISRLWRSYIDLLTISRRGEKTNRRRRSPSVILGVTEKEMEGRSDKKKERREKKEEEDGETRKEKEDDRVTKGCEEMREDHVRGNLQEDQERRRMREKEEKEEGEREERMDEGCLSPSSSLIREELKDSYDIHMTDRDLQGREGGSPFSSSSLSHTKIHSHPPCKKPSLFSSSIHRGVSEINRSTLGEARNSQLAKFHPRQHRRCSYESICEDLHLHRALLESTKVSFASATIEAPGDLCSSSRLFLDEILEKRSSSSIIFFPDKEHFSLSSQLDGRSSSYCRQPCKKRERKEEEDEKRVWSIGDGSPFGLYTGRWSLLLKQRLALKRYDEMMETFHVSSSFSSSFSSLAFFFSSSSFLIPSSCRRSCLTRARDEALRLISTVTKKQELLSSFLFSSSSSAGFSSSFSSSLSSCGRGCLERSQRLFLIHCLLRLIFLELHARNLSELLYLLPVLETHLSFIGEGREDGAKKREYPIDRGDRHEEILHALGDGITGDLFFVRGMLYIFLIERERQREKERERRDRQEECLLKVLLRSPSKNLKEGIDKDEEMKNEENLEDRIRTRDGYDHRSEGSLLDGDMRESCMEVWRERGEEKLDKEGEERVKEEKEKEDHKEREEGGDGAQRGKKALSVREFFLRPSSSSSTTTAPSSSSSSSFSLHRSSSPLDADSMRRNEDKRITTPSPRRRDSSRRRRSKSKEGEEPRKEETTLNRDDPILLSGSGEEGESKKTTEERARDSSFQRRIRIDEESLHGHSTSRATPPPQRVESFHKKGAHPVALDRQGIADRYSLTKEKDLLTAFIRREVISRGNEEEKEKERVWGSEERREPLMKRRKIENFLDRREIDDNRRVDKERYLYLRGRSYLERAVEIWEEKGSAVGIVGGRQQMKRYREACIVILSAYIRELKDLRNQRIHHRERKKEEVYIHSIPEKDEEKGISPSMIGKENRYLDLNFYDDDNRKMEKKKTPQRNLEKCDLRSFVSICKKEEERGEERRRGDCERGRRGRENSLHYQRNKEDEEDQRKEENEVLSKEKRMQFVKKRIQEYRLKLRDLLLSSHS